MARSLLVHDALAEGRLVRVLPPSWDMPSSKAHIVRWPSALIGDQRVRDFVGWVTAEAKATAHVDENAIFYFSRGGRRKTRRIA
jgi:LysR family glycine cleavage system transcriptional activator